MREELIDREREVADLQRLADRGRPGIAIVYGRRRVGKTFLLRRAWGDRRVFHFLAADVTPERNRAELLRSLVVWLGRPLAAEDYPTWRSVFRLLLDLARDAPLVVVLDEFQYLLGDREDDASSQLVSVWDLESEGRELLLVLCGSEVATMRALTVRDAPLYGRASWVARVDPFDYLDAARMAPHLGHREAARLYGIFGGTPRYLATLAPGESVDDAAVRTFLDPRGEVHSQLETLIEQEKGIREPTQYRSVLTAVAESATELNEIAQQSGVRTQPQRLRQLLNVLEELELIERERNFAAAPTAPYRYYVTDHAVAFWYRFVQPSRDRLVDRAPRLVWDGLVAPNLDSYMGRVFEGIVRQAYRRHHRRWRLPGAREWSRWQGRDRNRRSIEIDLVARLDDGRILTGVVKWSSAGRGFELHSGLRRNLEDLASSGHGWAREALAGPHLYVAAGGFTTELRRWAREEPDVRLLALPEIYRPSS